MEGYVRAQHLLGEGSLEKGWERFLENSESCFFLRVSRCVSSRGLRVEVVVGLFPYSFQASACGRRVVDGPGRFLTFWICFWTRRSGVGSWH